MAIKIAEVQKPAAGERLIKSAKQAPVISKENTGRTGRPKTGTARERVTLYLDAFVLAHYRSLGDGWQAKLNDDLLGLIGLAGHE